MGTYQSDLEYDDGVVTMQVTHRLPAAATVNVGTAGKTIVMTVKLTGAAFIADGLGDAQVRTKLEDAAKALAIKLREAADRCDAFAPLTPPVALPLPPETA